MISDLIVGAKMSFVCFYYFKYCFFKSNYDMQLCFHHFLFSFVQFFFYYYYLKSLLIYLVCSSVNTENEEQKLVLFLFPFFCLVCVCDFEYCFLLKKIWIDQKNRSIIMISSINECECNALRSIGFFLEIVPYAYLNRCVCMCFHRAIREIFLKIFSKLICYRECIWEIRRWAEQLLPLFFLSTFHSKYMCKNAM